MSSSVRQSKLSKKLLVIDDFPAGFLWNAVDNLEWALEINEWVDKNQAIGYTSSKSGKKIPIYSPIRGLINHLHTKGVSGQTKFLELQVPLDEDLPYENVEKLLLKDALVEFDAEWAQRTAPMYRKILAVALFAALIPIGIVAYFGFTVFGIILGVLGLLIMAVVVYIAHWLVYFSNAYKDLLFYDAEFISKLNGRKARYIESG